MSVHVIDRDRGNERSEATHCNDDGWQVGEHQPGQCPPHQSNGAEEAQPGSVTVSRVCMTDLHKTHVHRVREIEVNGFDIWASADLQTW